MTKEQFDGLKRGDTVWIKGTLLSYRPDADWFVDIPGGLKKFDEDALLHAVELELSRPSPPEGFEEFWPGGRKDLEVGHKVGETEIRALDPGPQIYLDGATSGVSFLALKALGVPFYRPIKKEPEEAPIPDILGNPVSVASLIVAFGFAKSNSEARNLIKQGAVSVGETKVTDPFVEFERALIQGETVTVGKRVKVVPCE